MKIKEIVSITERNLRAVEGAERMAKKNYDLGYYKGKADALSHILDLLEESNGK